MYPTVCTVKLMEVHSPSLPVAIASSPADIRPSTAELVEGLDLTFN